MTGIHRSTAQPLTGSAEILHSIGVILTTPLGTRVMRRPFGSHLFDLVDSPATPGGALTLIAAAADAIERWEKRVVFVSGAVSAAADGRALLTTRVRLVADGSDLETTTVVGGIA